MVRNANADLVTVEMDGITSPLSSVPQCFVCSSKYRDEVERHLAAGRTYRAIAALLPSDADLTPRNLRDHLANGYLDLDAPAVQRASRQQEQDLQATREPLVQAKAAHLSSPTRSSAGSPAARQRRGAAGNQGRHRCREAHRRD